MLEERAALDVRLSQLHETIGSLTRLCGYTPTVSWGLTDAIRIVLHRAGESMTAMDVRDRLAAIGFDLSKYTNDMSAIHTVLKRLNRAGEVQLVPGVRGEHAYRPARLGTVVLDNPHALVPFEVFAPPRSGRGRRRK